MAAEAAVVASSDRTSSATMQANQLRLWFASMAYVLPSELRRIALRHTQFADENRFVAIRSLVAILLALVSATPAAAGERELTFGYPYKQKNAFHDAAAEIIRRAYAYLDIAVAYKASPSERALQMSNKGLVDGELVRIKGIEATYPNLIRVPVSHVTAEQMAFGRDPSVKIDGWNSLKPYRLAFHRGYKVAERNTVGMDRHLSGTDVNAFIMVENGRSPPWTSPSPTGSRAPRSSRITA